MIDPLLMMSAITYWWNLGLLNKMPLTSLGFITFHSIIIHLSTALKIKKMGEETKDDG